MPTIVDVDDLGKAIHLAKRVGGPWGPPCGYPKDPLQLTSKDWTLIDYDDNSKGEYDCLCKSMSQHLLELING